METFIGTTFTLGTSTVLTLPKGLGIKSGVRAKIKKVGSGLNIQLKTLPANDKNLTRDIALIKKLSGSNKSKFILTPDEMNNIYDKEVYG
jgi:hypothetical protein